MVIRHSIKELLAKSMVTRPMKFIVCSIQRIHTVLIVFELPSLALYMLRGSVILEADLKLRIQYFY